MGEDPNSEFVKLSQGEALTRLNLLAGQKAPVKVWKQDLVRALGQIEGCHKGDELIILLKIDRSESVQVVTDEKILLSFYYRGLTHFIRAIACKNNEADKLEIKVDGDIYKRENRETQRLLTFPHHQAYVYFRVEHDVSEKNVLAFNQSRDKKIQNFKNFEKKISDSEDFLSELMGFRVLDISNDGLSLLVHKKEGSFFSTDIEMEAFYFTFTMNGELIELKANQIIYNIDYVSSGSSFGPMCKVGLQIFASDKLEGLIEKYIAKDENEKKVLKDFEDFVKYF